MVDPFSIQYNKRSTKLNTYTKVIFFIEFENVP